MGAREDHWFILGLPEPRALVGEAVGGDSVMGLLAVRKWAVQRWGPVGKGESLQGAGRVPLPALSSPLLSVHHAVSGSPLRCPLLYHLLWNWLPMN